MKISGIYKIQSIKKPERCYIGSALNIKNRWFSHLNYLDRGKHNKKLQNHYNKYGKEDLIFIIIEPCLPDFLLIREQYYLDTLHPYFNVCITAGNSYGVRATEETKRKMSEQRMGHYGWNKGKRNLFQHTEDHKQRMSKLKLGIPRSQELRDKISKTLTGKYKGENNPFYGKNHSKETIELIKQSNIGRTPYNKGKKGLMKHTEEWKIQHSKDMEGINNPMFGKTHPKETRDKIRNSRLKAS